MTGLVGGKVRDETAKYGLSGHKDSGFYLVAPRSSSMEPKFPPHAWLFSFSCKHNTRGRHDRIHPETLAVAV